MATYIPNAQDATEPTLDKKVSSAALEFRTLKTFTDTTYDNQLAFQAQLDALQTAIGAGDNSVALAANLAASAGSSMIGFIQAGSGAVTRTSESKVREAISVMDFGAVGDAVHDDTVPFQEAIDYAQLTRRKLIIPGVGTSYYKITDTLNVSKSLTIEGEDKNALVFGVGLIAGQYLIDVDGSVAPNLENVTIDRLTLRHDTAAPNLLRWKDVSNSLIRDVNLYNGTKGVVITGTRNFGNKYEKIGAPTKTVTSTVSFEAFTGGGQHVFDTCSFYGHYGVNLDSASGINALSFLGCNFELCDFAFYSEAAIKGLLFSACRFEKNVTAASLQLTPVGGNVVSGLAIHGCFFETDGELYAIHINGPVTGFSILGNYAQDYSIFVRMNGAGASGIIAGNFLSAVGNIVNANRSGVLVVNNSVTAGVNNAQFNPPSVAAALNAAAIDPTTTMALCNQLRAALIATGLAS